MARKKPSAAKPQYFEYQDAKSHKFWEITLEGKSHTVRFGKVGTDGQTRTKSFKTAEAAAVDVERLVKQKTGKGYAPVKGSRQSSAKKKESETKSKKKATPKKSTTHLKKKAAGKASAIKQRSNKKKAAKKKAAAKLPAVSEGPPKLYYVEPDVFQGKKWVGEVLTVNCLDMDLDDWWKQFDQHAKKPGIAGKPLPMIVERHGRSQDCLYTNPFQIYRGKVAGLMGLTQSAWKKLEQQLSGDVNTVPVKVTRETQPAGFGFPKLAAKDQFKGVLMAPKLQIPFRHGQRLFWQEEKKQFVDMAGLLSGQKTLPKIDPDELGDSLLFLLEQHVVATEGFVRKANDAGISGFCFTPIEYEPTLPIRLPKPKQLLEPIGKYPATLVADGWSSQLAAEWERLWEWTDRGLKNRSWPSEGFFKTESVEEGFLEQFERDHGLRFPASYRVVLENYAASATVDHGCVDPTDPRAEYQRLLRSKIDGLSFDGEQPLWDIAELEEYSSMKDWLIFDEEELAEGELIPILTVANGDIVVIDSESEEVSYWSHENDDELNGRLGMNFIDFITRWSWLGVPWIDFLPDTDFYDEKKRCLYARETAPIRKWHRWLQGHELS